MIVRDIASCRRMRVRDGSALCELLHPGRDPALLGLRISIAHAIVRSGEQTLPHILHTATEIYYILQGEGIMHIRGETQAVRPGQAIVIPPGAVQSIENTGAGDLAFLAIADPFWRDDDEILLERQGS